MENRSRGFVRALGGRPGARRRGYDQAWDRAAGLYRQHYPFCVGCLAMGRRIEATVVDHVIPHHGNRILFWERSNWQSVCAWHHNAIKPQLERMYRNGIATAVDLRLSSKLALGLSREQYKPAVGVDGFAAE